MRQENAGGVSRDEMAAALMEVVDGRTSKQVMWPTHSCQDSVAAVAGLHVYHDKARRSKHTVCI